MQLFQEKLRTLRKRRGMTQKQLAEQLGFSKSFVRDLECGYNHPNIKHALKIADFFGVTVDQLVRDELELDP